MKNFRFKHTPLVWVLLSIVLVLSLTSVVWNIITIINTDLVDVGKTIASILIIVAGTVLTIFVLSVMVYSKYVVKENAVVLYFGFIPTKLKIDEIVQISHFKKSDKLVLYFIDTKYTVVVISPTLYDNFVKSIREKNDKIIFSVENQIQTEE